MKNLLVLLSISTLLIIQSCQKTTDIEPENPSSGSIYFLLPTNEGSTNSARISNLEIPNGSSLKIGIETTESTPTLSQHTLELLNINREFISPPLSLGAGNYNLVEYFIVSPENEVIFAAPLTGSSLANDVDEPLPIAFSIETGVITQLSPEVVSLQNLTPEDLGYLSFQLNTVDHFFVSVFQPTENGFVLADAEAFIISNIGDTIKNLSLDATVNRIASVLDIDEEFTLVVIKSGYGKYSETFILTEIRDAYQNTIPVVLAPALTFIAYPEQSLTNSSLEFLIGIRHNEGTINIDWGDGTNDTYEYNNYSSKIHEYDQLGGYFVSVTGDIQYITGITIYYDQYAFTDIDLQFLPNLEDFRCGLRGEDQSPSILDFTHNPKLEYLDILANPSIEKVIIPEPNSIRYLFFSHTRMSSDDIDDMINPVYESAITADRKFGSIFWNSDTYGPPYETPLSDESRQKLIELKNVYGWNIDPDPEL